MTDDFRMKVFLDLRDLLQLNDDISQDVDVKVPCPLHTAPGSEADHNLTLNQQQFSFRCEDQVERGSLDQLLKVLQARTPGGRSLVAEPVRAPPVRDAPGWPEDPDRVIDVAYSETPLRATNPALLTEPKVMMLRNALPSRAEIEAQAAAAREERLRLRSERIIISVIAVIFLLAGLAAAGLSGFANYQAFSMSVADPLQGRVWGFAGVIAAIVSFAGFTFFYWHGANRRVWEAVRSLVFALIGMGASILGTEMYIAANNRAADAELKIAGSNRAALETQLADWRRQLAGIPPETRSVGGLEIYIAEVERVGRTEQKPYRDAQNELGLARRRDDLQARIDAATAELLGRGSGDILLQAEARTALPSWLFAAMLELFSSQGTSIGLVALLVLFSRRQRGAAA